MRKSPSLNLPISKTLRKRITLTISIILATLVMIFSSMPFKDWSVAVAAGLLGIMCLFGLWAVWTRPMRLDDPDDASEPEIAPIPGRRAKKRIRLF
ncbi:MAG: hypothetical protein WCZ28_01510 [Burkholderiaceae bacterium]